MVNALINFETSTQRFDKRIIQPNPYAENSNLITRKLKRKTFIKSLHLIYENRYGSIKNSWLLQFPVSIVVSWLSNRGKSIWNVLKLQMLLNSDNVALSVRIASTSFMYACMYVCVRTLVCLPEWLSVC